MLQYLDADFLLLNFAGLIGLALGIWIFSLDPGSRLNRVFALILVARSLPAIMGPLPFKMAPEDVATANAILAWLPYLVIVFIPLVVYFVSVYPHPRGIIGRTRWGPWALLGVTAIACLWYALDHSIYGTAVLRPGSSPTFRDGPLLVLYGLRAPMMALAGLILAIDYLRRPAGSQGYSIFLLAAALAVGSLFNGTLFAAEAWRTYGSWTPSAIAQTPIALSTLVQTLALPLGLATVALMMMAIRHEKQDATLQEARRFVVVVAPAAMASGVLAGIAPLIPVAGSTLAKTPFLSFVMGFWGLLVPLMVTYALLRFSLFDIDIRLKAGVRRAIVLGAFATTFFVVSESAEALFAGDRGPLFGIAAAALLAAGARPLQAAAAKAADKLMPDTVPLHLLSPRQRESMYREQFLLVGSDGTVTTKERRMLGDLAEALHLDAKQTTRLETSDKIRGSTKAPTTVPAPPQRQGNSALRGAIVATMTALALGALSAFLEYLVPVSDFVMGLLSAAAITVLLGPIERLAMRLAGQTGPAIDASSLRLFNKELDAALSDGDWSRRDRRYLGGLAEHLGIDPKTRRRLTKTALAAKGVATPWWRPRAT